MNDTVLASQDTNRPISSTIGEDFGESLDRIGLKIRSLQNELTACASKSKKGSKFYSDPSKSKIPFKEKCDIHSKENREQYLSTSSKKTQRTPRLCQKGLEATYRSGLENTSDITQSFGLIETLENDDEVIISPELKEKLRIVFENYSRINDKGLPFQLRLSKYRRMMTDSGLVDSISLEDLEVLFLGHNQHKTVIEFEAFLTLLPKIACARYPLSSYTANQGLHLLVTRYILPLNSQTGSVSDFYSESGMSTMRDEPADEGVLVVLKSVYTTLMKIYKEFFSWEVKGIENPALLAQNSENAFWNFLKVFEICPGLITKAVGQSLWTQREKSRSLLFSSLKDDCELHAWFKKKDAGVVFKFTKFCEFIVSLSFIVYRNHCESGQSQLNEAEQVASLLGKLQYTKGMAKYALKGSLIVPKETLEKVVSRQNASKEGLWLCPANEQVLGKGQFQNSFNDEKDRAIENYLTQRSKTAVEVHNKILHQKGV